jgi:hypothetical protein
MASDTTKSCRNKQKLEDLFDFSKISGGKERCERYQSFFEAVACIIIGIKFFEYEKESPLTREILEFFEIDTLAPLLINRPIGTRVVTDEMTIEVLFEFIFAKQIEILVKIDFKISPVNL